MNNIGTEIVGHWERRGDDLYLDGKLVPVLNATTIDATTIDGQYIKSQRITTNDVKIVNGNDTFAGQVELGTNEISILDPDYVTESELAVAADFFGIEIGDRQRDLMYVRFKLVHANTNKNGDRFLSEELKAAEKTPIHKLINWGHGEPNIGVIVASKFVEGPEDEDDYLECIGAIAKLRYPDFAKQIIERYNEGKLYFSMETWFKEVELIESDESALSEMLRADFAEGKVVTRILKSLTFAGAAIVENPADIEASALALASKKTNPPQEENNLKTYTQEEVDALVKVAAENALVEHNLSKLQNDNETLNSRITELETSVASILSEKEAIASEKDSLTNQYQEVQDKFVALNTELESIKVEYANYKINIELDSKASARIDELKELGIKVPAKADEKYPEYFDKIRKMDDVSFDILKEIVPTETVSNASTHTETVVTADTKEGAGPGLPLGGLSNDNVEERKTRLSSVLRDIYRKNNTSTEE